MSIKLDWEVEAEEPRAFEAGEDPSSRRERRRARLWVVLVVLGTLAVFAGIALAIGLRLRAVNEQVEQALVNAVDAEVAALRIGDQNSFLNAQRSATGDWLNAQQQTFNNYQTMKQNGNIQLTGRVLETAFEGPRAWAKVEEIVDGIPYARLWFYWRYDDGWRHVPPDYTFWGAAQTASADGVVVRYRTVDEALAGSMAASLESWLLYGCEVLTCGELPVINVEIVADRTATLGWVAGDDWRLQVPSPYLDRARYDMPFDTGLQLQVANLIAERLVALATGGMQPQYPADVYYLRSAVVSWLVGRFAQVNTNSFLVSSLAANYGDHAVGQLTRAMQPLSDISLLNSATGTASLEAANLDWRDFLTWRLALEAELIARREEANFLTLYDGRDAAARDLAYQRYNAGAPAEQRVVVSAQAGVGEDGSTVLNAVVEVGGDPARQETVLFRLVDGVWRRAN